MLRGRGGRGTWQLRPLFVLLPCLRVELAHGQKQMVPFGHADGWQQDAFGTVSSLESSPSCCHHSVLEGVVFEPVGCAKLLGRGEKQYPKTALSLTFDDGVIIAAKTPMAQCTDPGTHQPGQAG